MLSLSFSNSENKQDILLPFIRIDFPSSCVGILVVLAGLASRIPQQSVISSTFLGFGGVLDLWSSCTAAQVSISPTQSSSLLRAHFKKRDWQSVTSSDALDSWDGADPRSQAKVGGGLTPRVYVNRNGSQEMELGVEQLL